jgi:hypothetical protein
MIIFGLEREAITGDWRKLHNLERNNLNCSANRTEIIKNVVV